MFEDDVDGNGLPCDHPIRWWQRLAALIHKIVDRIDPVTFWCDRFPQWVCDAHERVSFQFPCAKCEADRTREYGVLYKTDEDVIAKFPLNWDEEIAGDLYDPDEGVA